MYPRSIRVITREARTAALAAQELVWHPLCNGSRQGGVSHAPLSGDRTGTLPLGKTLASNAPLQIGQLGLEPHVDHTLAGSSSAIVGTLDDPLAFVLRKGAQESNEAATYGRREVQVWLVEHLLQDDPG